MDDALAAEHGPQFRRSEAFRPGDAGGQRRQLAASVGGTIPGADQQVRRAAFQRSPGFFETGDGGPGPAGKADQVRAPRRQPGLHPPDEVRRHFDGTPEGPGKMPPRRRLGEDVLARLRPHPASRQALIQIRDQRPVGSDDEADHPGARQRPAADDASPMAHASRVPLDQPMPPMAAARCHVRRLALRPRFLLIGGGLRGRGFGRGGRRL